MNFYIFHSVLIIEGYWHQRADERHGKPPPRQPGAINGKDKVGRPPGEFGVRKSM